MRVSSGCVLVLPELKGHQDRTSLPLVRSAKVDRRGAAPSPVAPPRTGTTEARAFPHQRRGSASPAGLLISVLHTPPRLLSRPKTKLATAAPPPRTFRFSSISSRLNSFHRLTYTPRILCLATPAPTAGATRRPKATGILLLLKATTRRLSREATTRRRPAREATIPPSSQATGRPRRGTAPRAASPIPPRRHRSSMATPSEVSAIVYSYPTPVTMAGS